MLRPRLINIGAAVIASSALLTPTGSNAHSGMRAVQQRIEDATKRAGVPNRITISRQACARDVTDQTADRTNSRPVLTLWRNANPAIRLASRAR